MKVLLSLKLTRLPKRGRSADVAVSLRVKRRTVPLLKRLKSLQRMPSPRSLGSRADASAITAASPSSQLRIRKIQQLKFRLRSRSLKRGLRASRKRGPTMARRKPLKVARLGESDVNLISSGTTGTEEVAIVVDVVAVVTTKATMITHPSASPTTEVVRTTTVVEAVTTVSLKDPTTTTTTTGYLASTKGLARSVPITLPQVMVGKKK